MRVNYFGDVPDVDLTMKANWSKSALVGCLVSFLAAWNQNQVVAPTLSDETLFPIAAPLLVADAQTGPAATLSIKERQKDGKQMTPPPSPGSPSGLESLIEEAKEDLARRLSISVVQISLTEAKEVVWPDSSLGCPQPGMRYKQVPEDGALIILQAQGKVYQYHNGGRRGLFLCEEVFRDPHKPPRLDIRNLTPLPPLKKDNPKPSAPDHNIPPGEDH